jgi:hypothetical protein
VAVNGDLLNELNETFSLNLSNPLNATLADAQGTATIQNDDAVPGLSINDVSVIEGNSGTANATFTVTLSAASGLPVSVNYVTANGTAAAGVDYNATSGTVSIPPGSTTATIIVGVNGDLLNEAHETYFINLSNPSNATIADGQGVGTITNDDGAPEILIHDMSGNEGNSGTTPLSFMVSLSSVSGQNVTVQYATEDGTATVADNDYVATSGTLTIPPGQASGSIPVQVNGDTKLEGNETFIVHLTSPVNATIANALGSGTIVNDDPKTIAIQPGWNMISDPVSVVHDSVRSIFPSAASSGFGYDASGLSGGGYQVSPTIQNGRGYWLKFYSGKSVDIVGAPLEICADTVYRGWNMIGTPAGAISPSNIVQSPSGSAHSAFFGYNQGYYITDSLRPGKGYWVKVDQDGVLGLSGTFHSQTTAGRVSPADYLRDLNMITITDAEGRKQTLYIGVEPKSGVPKDIFEVPPQPPAGIFDVRFASQQMAVTYPAALDKSQDHKIQISSAAYPLRIAWTMKAHTSVLRLRIDGKEISMKENGSAEVRQPEAPLIIRVPGSSELPREFGLAQNYPNPFNPTTAIRIALPQDARVKLIVYNTLGEEVRTLVNDVMEAGYQTVELDGSNLASGVYFYRIEAVAREDANKKFDSVMKMVLIK